MYQIHLYKIYRKRILIGFLNNMPCKDVFYLNKYVYKKNQFILLINS